MKNKIILELGAADQLVMGGGNHGRESDGGNYAYI